MKTPDQERPVEPESAEVAAERAKIRRRKAIALGIALALFAVTFYALTIIKMGPALFDRAL